VDWTLGNNEPVFGKLILINVTLQGGEASSSSGYGWGLGGAVLVHGAQSTLTLINSTVTSNTADSGGGAIYNYGGATTTLIGSTVSNNSSSSFGAGIVNDGGNLTLTGSTVSGNTANGGSGGGIWNNSTLTITNSTITGNTSIMMDGSGGWGGGIDCPDSSNPTDVVITNATISNNSAQFGGGIAGGDLSGSNSLRLKNSILVGNSDAGGHPNCMGTFLSDGYNLVGDITGCDFASQDTDLATSTPEQVLGVLSDNGGPTFTQALLPSSPAIDVIPFGVNGCGMTIQFDQRGVIRPQPDDGNCDIGAFEIEQASSDLDSDGDHDGRDLYLFITEYGSTDCNDCLADLDGDCDVDDNDLRLFVTSFGRI
jgi:hypothetical protein